MIQPKELFNHLVYSPKYNTDLGAFGINKPFALDRGEMVLKKLAETLGTKIYWREPVPLSDEEIRLVHTPAYLETLKLPNTWVEIFELKQEEYCPNSQSKPLPEIIDDIKLKCGGTLLSAELALNFGACANLGGGYHHAFPDQGRGFCVLNDIAIAVRSLQERKLAERFLIVDLDFHQGDGTALIFRDDPRVFTLSVHSHEGWPEKKQTSSLDIAIKTDESPFYLDRVSEGINLAMKSFSPDVVLYVAGSDPYEEDILPGTSFLKLSLQEMRLRDDFVIDYFAERKIPLSMVFAGGYGPLVWEVHYYAVQRLLERTGNLVAQSSISH